jgi:Gram-negative bacterial TonB protein C-terminal
MNHRTAAVSVAALLMFVGVGYSTAGGQAKRVAVDVVLKDLVKRSTLAQAGGKGFYLRARVQDDKHLEWEYNAEEDEYWASPTKWQRTIRSRGFSQTLIVNGDQRYEKNTGDYFPPEVERQFLSLVDPIPANILEQFEKLSMEIQQPDGKPGQCFADQYFSDEHGERVRAAVALDARTGLLNYLWFPGWSVGVFADYRLFHHKMIAWKTKDNPVNAEIDELREIEHPDEKLFVIKDQTPPAERIRTVLVNGAEYQKLVRKGVELKWPAVSGPPESGTIKVKIVTDREGRVRDARSYVSSNRELRDWTVEQVRGWEFKPYLVDGAAVQVETTLELEFKAELKSGAPSLPAANSYFDSAREKSGLRVEGAQAFHLKASFDATGNADLTGKGTYEETWVSPKQWRREGSLGGHVVMESRNGDLGYRKIDQEYSARRIDEAMDAIAAGLPGDRGPSSGPSWQVGNGQIGKAAMIQVWRGKVGQDGKPEANAQVYYFGADNGLLRGHHEMGALTLYNGFEDFSGKLVARRLSVDENDMTILKITIEQLEAAAPHDDAFFTITGVGPVNYGDQNLGNKITPAKPIRQIKVAFPDEVRRQGLHGKIVCRLLIDSHGHVRDVAFLEGVNPMVEGPVRATLLQWEYVPSTFNGHPGMSFATVEFQF